MPYRSSTRCSGWSRACFSAFLTRIRSLTSFSSAPSNTPVGEETVQILENLRAVRDHGQDAVSIGLD